MRIFNCMVVGMPNPHVVQGSVTFKHCDIKSVRLMLHGKGIREGKIIFVYIYIYIFAFILQMCLYIHRRISKKIRKKYS